MSDLRYGLTPRDLDNARTKIQKQKDFLESQSFLHDDSTGEVKTLLDFSYSANLSKRYYPRILNKVHTFVSLNTSRAYTPIFLTVTLDGFFRDFTKGKFDRFTGDIKEKYIKNSHIPNNDRMGYYLDRIEQKKILTPKDLYKILGWQLHRFIRSSTLQRIRRNGDDYSFIRVTEPHKNGVPHFHILLYIPKEYVRAVYYEFEKFFPAPQNHKLINFKEDKREAKTIFDNQKETKGFQTEIRSPAGYLLKYILKSFTNLINDDELDYLQAWYVHNKIPRIITTHTLISQNIYHHASLLDSDWFYLTEIKLNGHIEKDNLMNSFVLTSDRNRVLEFDNGYYKLTNDGIVIKEFGENKLFRYKFTVEDPTKILPHNEKYINCIFHKINFLHWRLVPKRKKYIYKIDEDYVDVQLDNDFIANYVLNKTTGELKNKRDLNYISKLSDQVLSELHVNFDFENDVLIRYPIIHNELIDRNILNDYYLLPNDFNLNFDYKENDELLHDIQPIIIKQLKPQDMKDEWLLKEFEGFKTIDIFIKNEYMARYSALHFEIEKRGI